MTTVFSALFEYGLFGILFAFFILLFSVTRISRLAAVSGTGTPSIAAILWAVSMAALKAFFAAAIICVALYLALAGLFVSHWPA